MPPQLSDFVDVDANALLATVQYSLPLLVAPPWNISEVRFGLASQPVINVTYAGFGLFGDVVPIADPVAPPLPVPALPPFWETAGGAFIQLRMSSYSLASACYTFFTAGLLQCEEGAALSARGAARVQVC